ncbi:LTA synthase family protein [Dendrosporobacter sp. 1207_IL3150]|uniref:LTA synthase family protein n=1 Tax=Dendrosporobacter sp. 1207_IL3150 TaxID=3084054 RepID=UPI002FD9C102
MISWERFYENLQQDFKLLLFVLAVMCLFRIGFIAVMHTYMGDMTAVGDVAVALYYGLRISLKSAGILALVSFILCCSLQFIFKQQNCRLRLLIGTGYLSLLSLLFYARIPYYEQFHMGFNQLIFNTFQDDVYALFYTLIEQYNLASRLVMTAITAWILRYLLKGWLELGVIHLPRFSRWYLNISTRAVFLLVIYYIVIFVRFGGSMTYAYNVDWENSGVTKDQLLNEAVLDDMQALYRAYELHERMRSSTGLAFSSEKMTEYGESLAGRKIETANLDDYLEKKAHGPKVERPRHIFLIIAESYANWPLLSQYKDLNIANGLKNIISQDDAAYVRTMLPNGMSTISGVLGVTTGFTDANLYLNCIPEGYREKFPTAIAPQMKKLGYKPRFWYAGPSSWERIKDFSMAQGFEEFYGSGDYNSSKGNVWGADDKYLLDAAFSGIEDDKSTFNVILTVSNHAPYTVNLAEEGFDQASLIAGLPERHRNNQELIKQLGHFWYADKVMSEFVQRVRTKYPDSLFLIVGDHADRLNIDTNPSMYERYGIPFVVYGNGINKNIFPEKTAGSHINIAPTLIELVAPKGFTYYSVGKSLTKSNNFGVNYGFWITSDYIGKTEDNVPEAIVSDTKAEEPKWERLTKEIDCLRAVSWWRIKNGNNLN